MFALPYQNSSRLSWKVFFKVIFKENVLRKYHFPSTCKSIYILKFLLLNLMIQNWMCTKANILDNLC